MSGKNKSRLSKKQKRKNHRKIKRNLRKMGSVGRRSAKASSVACGAVFNDQEQSWSVNDERPSTSRRSAKPLSPKKSPWRYAGGTVNRFNKIFDDQARRKIIKRRVFLVKDNTTLLKVSPKIVAARKASKRLINIKRTKALQKLANKVSTATLEEGEIRSDMDTSVTTTSSDAKKNVPNDEDDCVVIEPTLEEITIDDNDDEDFPYSSDTSAHDQAIMSAFKERDSSTPCQRKHLPTSQAPNIDDDNSQEDKIPFFIDVGRSMESINSTCNFSDYSTLSTLKETSRKSERRSVRLKPADDSDTIINVDDDIKDETLKRKLVDLDEDSVVFVSETSKNDFIPIEGDDIPPQRILKIDSYTRTPFNKLPKNNLFTNSEKKSLSKYNENAYNPAAATELTSGKRMIILDGSNIAFKHGLDQVFSVKGLKIAIEYFEKIGHEVKAIIPQFRMNRHKSSDPEELERLHKAGKIVQTPCKNLPGITSTSYDDRFILQLGFEMDAAIVSNDNYRDLVNENPAFRKIIENRVIGYTWCNDIFILPKDPYGKFGPSLATILNRC